MKLYKKHIIIFSVLIISSIVLFCSFVGCHAVSDVELVNEAKEESFSFDEFFTRYYTWIFYSILLMITIPILVIRLIHYFVIRRAIEKSFRKKSQRFKSKK